MCKSEKNVYFQVGLKLTDKFCFDVIGAFLEDSKTERAATTRRRAQKIHTGTIDSENLSNLDFCLRFFFFFFV